MHCTQSTVSRCILRLISVERNDRLDESDLHCSFLVILTTCILTTETAYVVIGKNGSRKCTLRLKTSTFFANYLVKKQPILTIIYIYTLSPENMTLLKQLISAAHCINLKSTKKVVFRQH